MRIFLLALAVLVVACDKNASSGEPAAAPPAPPATPVAPAAPQAPAAVQPLQPTAAAAPSAGGLTWSAPKPFVSRTPKSSMRVAEYGIEGDSLAELGVFYFGADQGGSVEDNMTRWVGQFTQPSGKATVPQRKARNVKGIIVDIVEAHGTYSGGMAMPGAPPATAQDDAMLLGAIAKGPSGSVFFKLVGPRASVENARAAFDGLLESLHPAP
jgi:hypothetical protein